MGDHSVLLVDRLLTESTLEAVIESENPLLATEDIMSDDLSQNLERNICSLKGNTVECRICHDEDEECNMEIPCSCCGSLKYAHRRCIQRWCNEKGDTICEICHQQFKPGYTAPPPLFHCGGISVNFRGNWEISRRDLHNPQFIEVATDPNFLGTNFENYSPPSSTSLICCRVIAIIDAVGVACPLCVQKCLTLLSKVLIFFFGFYNVAKLLQYNYATTLQLVNVPHDRLFCKNMFMVLLVLRHTLPIVLLGAGEYSLTLFTLLLLRTIGILLPIYAMVKAVTAIQHHRHSHQQVYNVDSHVSQSSSDEENEHQERQPLGHHIHVR